MESLNSLLRSIKQVRELQNLESWSTTSHQHLESLSTNLETSYILYQQELQQLVPNAPEAQRLMEQSARVERLYRETQQRLRDRILATVEEAATISPIKKSLSPVFEVQTQPLENPALPEQMTRAAEDPMENPRKLDERLVDPVKTQQGQQQPLQQRPVATTVQQPLQQPPVPAAVQQPLQQLLIPAAVQPQIASKSDHATTMNQNNPDHPETETSDLSLDLRVSSLALAPEPPEPSLSPPTPSQSSSSRQSQRTIMPALEESLAAASASATNTNFNITNIPSSTSFSGMDLAVATELLKQIWAAFAWSLGQDKPTNPPRSNQQFNNQQFNNQQINQPLNNSQYNVIDPRDQRDSIAQTMRYQPNINQRDSELQSTYQRNYNQHNFESPSTTQRYHQPEHDLQSTIQPGATTAAYQHDVTTDDPTLTARHPLTYQPSDFRMDHLYDPLLQPSNRPVPHHSTETTTVAPNNTSTTIEVPTDANCVNNQAPHISLKLDTLKLPTFDGDLTQWIAFRDQFVDLVHNNPNLTSITKFHQLRTHLRGAAYAAIDGFKLSATDYEVAWDILQKRYNQTDRIIDEYLKQFMSLPPLGSNKRAIHLINMVNRTNQLLRVLPSLGVDVTHWDRFLLYTLRERLDTYTLKKWIDQVKKRVDVPLTEFLDFLEVEATESVAFATESRNRMPLQPARVSNQLARANHRDQHRSDKYTPTTMVVAATSACAQCKGNHPIFRCRTFRALSVNDRHKKIKLANLCVICLGPNHERAECPFDNCPTCDKPHNSLLCYERAKELKNKKPSTEKTRYPSKETKKRGKETPQVSNITAHINNDAGTVLGTAQAQVINAHPWCNQIRALCDSGSQLNLITAQAVKRLGLVPERLRLSMTGAQDQPIGDAHGRVTLAIKVPKTKETIQSTLYVVNKISRQLPIHKLARIHSEFTELPLADPAYHVPGEIDALFGVRTWLRIIKNGIIKSRDESAVAQRTKLGWVIYQVEPEKALSNSALVSAITAKHISAEMLNIDAILRQFWELEDLPRVKRRSPDDEENERIFMSGVTRQPDGRYVVRLPFNNKIKLLGKSYNNALRQFQSLERRLKADQPLREQYALFMREYEALGHMHPVTDPHEEGYYIPHHAVRKKFRVVFNASCLTTTGISLNECQFIGEKQQDDLAIIMMRFRMYEYALTADVVKMFRQIMIHPEDRKYQRILWRHRTDEPIQTYELATVTYGQAAAPFLSVRALRQCAVDHQEKYPVGATHALTSFYVDDLLSGADTVQDALVIHKQLTDMLAHGKFELAKWCSNNSELNTRLNAHIQDREIIDPDVTTILGLKWIPIEDALTYKLQDIEHQDSLTKRSILSQIGRLYDPNGFITPITVTAKCIMQEMWKTDCGWDDEIGPEIRQQWLDFQHELPVLEWIRIPRWIGTKQIWSTELCGFSDASEKAYAAVVYLRTTDDLGQIHLSLLGSKSKVAPLKSVSIPRLELCGAHLLSKYVSTIMDNFSERIKSVHLWTDSTVTHQWIQKHPSSMKTFVANRVAAIQEATTEKGYNWYWTPGEQNPADLATRGTTPTQLHTKSIWWSGPEWLQFDQSQWPIKPTIIDEDTSETIQEVKIVNTITTKEPLIRGSWFGHRNAKPTAAPILEAYESYNRTRNVMATVIRAIRNFKLKKDQRQFGPITSEEKERARLKLIQLDQQLTYRKEIQNLLDKDAVSPKDSNHWFDKDTGILRLSGRVQTDNLTTDSKFPALIHPNGQLATLLIKQAHRQTLHGGPQQVLQLIREQYWIPRARRLAKSIINLCANCFRYRMQLRTQLMAPLPTARTLPARPFAKCAVDCLGPVGILASALRGAKTVKGWITVFVCMSTRAIHLELVGDSSAEKFIQALRRLIGRRGPIHEIWSDNGKNFVGAHNILTKFTEENTDWNQRITRETSIHWHFATPRAPHHGGFYEAAVKSVKKHLKRVLNDRKLTFEEYSTLLTQIEACVNSRPITPLNDDPQDLTALTPGHFLVGEPLVTLTEPKPYDFTSVSYQKRWELLQKTYQHFWKRWHDEYLSTLINRTKWLTRERNLQPNDMVLIKEDKLPPSRWRLGRIIDVYKAADGSVRSVRVLTKTGMYNRPIVRLGLLVKRDKPEGSEEVQLEEIHPALRHLNPELDDAEQNQPATSVR